MSSRNQVVKKTFYRLSELASIAGCTEDDVLYFFETYTADLSVSLHGVSPSGRTYSWIDGIDRCHRANGATVYVPTLDALYELHIDAIRALHRDGRCVITRAFADRGLCTVTLSPAIEVDRSMVFVKHVEAARFLAAQGTTSSAADAMERTAKVEAVEDGSDAKELPPGDAGDKKLLAKFQENGGKVTTQRGGKAHCGGTRGALARTAEYFGKNDTTVSDRIKRAHGKEAGDVAGRALMQGLTRR